MQETWVYDLIAAIDEYEDTHGDHEAGWACLDSALAHVPERELDRARAISAYRRQKPDPEPTVIHCTEYVTSADPTVATRVRLPDGGLRFTKGDPS